MASSSSLAWLVGAVLSGLVACGDSGNVGGENAGGSNVGAANAGGGGASAGGGGANAGGQSTEEACEELVGAVDAKFESCGFKEGVGGGAVGGGGVGGAATFECTEDDVATLECMKPCFEAAPCSALDGSDKKEQEALNDCIGACP